MISKSNKNYLTETLPKYIPMHANNKYLFSFRLLKTKRFLLQTLIVFVFQYLILFNFTFTLPPLPMNPSMGLAFSFFYLIGKNAVPGIFLAGICAYFLKGFQTSATFLYIAADLGLGCYAAFLSDAILSADIRTFSNDKETLKFLKTNAIICLFSGLLRLIADFINFHPEISLTNILFNYIDHFFADLNGILIIFSFLISWVHVPFTQEKVFRGALNKLPAILITLLILGILLYMNHSSLHIFIIAILAALYLSYMYGRNKIWIQERLKKTPIIALLIFILISILFLNSVELLYFIIIMMLLALYLYPIYGYLIATASLFVLASLYMVCFASLKDVFVERFGLPLYTFVPLFLFIYILLTFYAGLSKTGFGRPSASKAT